MPGIPVFKPMLATLVNEPFDEEGWIYEIKWDGYRALAFVDKNKAELRSRNDKSFNDKFYPVVEALQSLKFTAVLDGEIVVVNDNGVSNFSALQNWRSEADGHLLFYVFDILWLNGKDLCALPLTERKKILKKKLPGDDIIRLSENFPASANELFDAAANLGLEGIIAKKKESVYKSGLRSRDWLKIKVNKRHEVVIGGYTKNEGSSKPFSALLVGVYQNGQLEYTGKIGTGFNSKAQTEMLRMFKPLLRKKSPFKQTPDVNKPSRFRPDPPKAEAFWLKPELVCEVSYAELTSDGIMRHPSFEGIRTDKNASEVKEEKAIRPPAKTQNKLLRQPGKKNRRSLLNPHEETQVKKIDGNELKFNNLSKIFWPKLNVSKREVINYYYRIAPFMLPHLIDRPQSMNRFPNGINGKSFYQKDVTGKAPSWVNTYLYHSEADERDKHFLVCSGEASLLYMASLGCIEINPWNSTTKNPDHPDWCIIDLDPGEKTKFEEVIDAALATKKVLDIFGIPGYCKTSGSSGLHIYIPLGAKYNYEICKEFGRLLAKKIHGLIPEFTSIERIVKNRSGKLYIDFLQNRPQATVASVYSLRPKEGATVSMPLYWEEVKRGLKMTDFTIFNAVERVQSEGDLFKPVLGKGINIEAILKKHNLKLPV